MTCTCCRGGEDRLGPLERGAAEAVLVDVEGSPEERRVAMVGTGVVGSDGARRSVMVEVCLSCPMIGAGVDVESEGGLITVKSDVCSDLSKMSASCA